MPPRKKPAPKASDVLEKQQSEAAKRSEKISLFYAEGETFYFEGLPETTENLVVKMFARDAQGETHLVDVTAEPVAPGAFKATVPELYAKEEPETYAVCGVPIPVRNYTQDEYLEWLDLSQERKLEEGQAQIRKILADHRDQFQTGVDAETAGKRLPAFVNQRDALIELEAKDLFAFMKAGDYGQPSGAEKLDIVNGRIKDLVAVIEQANIDPMEHFDKTSEGGQKLRKLEQAEREANLEFVHRLAERDSLTEEPFEAWKKRATREDFDNATELMNEGNDSWVYGKGAEPLTRTERRRLMRELNRALKKATREALKN